MKAIYWQLFSGVFWFILILISDRFSLLPSEISAVRASYVALFSIFLLSHIESDKSDTNASPFIFLGISTPLILYFLNESIDTEFVVIVFIFYLIAIPVLQIRGNSNQMKKGYWDLLPPIIFLLIILLPQSSYPLAFFLILIIYIARKSLTLKLGSLDKMLFKQVPLICFAPVVAILFRDIMDNQQIYNINRKYLEIIGLIFSGVTAAICNGLVMRYSEKLLVFFTSFSIFFTALIPFIFFINSFIFDLFIYESLRMAIWMGFTYVFLKSGLIFAFMLGCFSAFMPLIMVYISGKVEIISIGNSILSNPAFVGNIIVFLFLIIYIFSKNYQLLGLYRK